MVGGHIDEASVTSKVKGSNSIFVGHFHGRWQFAVARPVAVPDTRDVMWFLATPDFRVLFVFTPA